MEMAEKQLFHVRKQEKSKYVGLEGVFHLHWPWECCFSLCIKDTKSPPQKLLGDRCVDMGILEGSLKGLTGNRELSFCNPASVVWRLKIRW